MPASTGKDACAPQGLSLSRRRFLEPGDFVTHLVAAGLEDIHVLLGAIEGGLEGAHFVAQLVALRFGILAFRGRGGVL